MEVETSSFHVATDSSPILSSLPEIETTGPEMILTEDLETVIVGALVSFAGVGGFGSTGVTGAGGVGGSGSSPQQATMNDSARMEKSILTG